MSDDFEERLDSPLIVHKETDASYEECASEVNVSKTHIEENKATLERHRFKKKKKNSKAPYFICAVMVLAAVFVGLYYGGIIPDFLNLNKETTAPQVSNSQVSTTEANRFEGIITVKGTYLFFEGKEIDGTEALISEIKYLDSGKSFIIQDENADSTFLNDEIIPILTSYNIPYEVKFVVSSGLIGKNETTAPVSSSESVTQMN